LALEEKGEMYPSGRVKGCHTLQMECQVVVLGRYMKAILPDELASARTVRDGIEVLRTSDLCYAMFSGIWNPGKKYVELLQHAGRFLRDLCEELENKIESIAALMGLWFGKAKLHRDAPQPPLKCITFLVIQAAIVGAPPSSEFAPPLERFQYEIEHGRMEVKGTKAITFWVPSGGSRPANLENEVPQRRLAAGLTNELKSRKYF
jgi:hypothetical protein